MKAHFRIIPDFKNVDCFTVHPDSAKQLGIINRKKSFLRFGITSYEVKIAASYDVEQDVIVLSSKVIDLLKIQLFLSYAILLKGNELIIGPYIGILATHKEERLNETVKTLSNYVYDYQHIGGAVLAFSLEGINKEDLTVKGYIYNPTTKLWEKGVYAYPASIFKRIGTNRDWRNHFHSVVGDNVFNDYIFNKWEMFNWLNELTEMKPYLPDSIVFRKSADFKFFLNLYNTVYIKPIYGSQGLGVIKASKKGSQAILKYVEDGRNVEMFFSKILEAGLFLRKKIGSGKYMIQKAVNLISYENKIIDFRLLILKDMHGEWQDIGMVARYGKKNSIVSNISSGGSAELGEITLKNILSLTDEEVFKLRKEMSTIAIKAAQSIESCGVHCGNLGIDLAIDTDRHIWIIEINNKDPNHTIALDANQRQMFYNSKLTTILYAKKLAGF